MPDPTLSDAIAEAYASAPVDQIILHTLELHHPSFTQPIRVVRDRVALDARLEATAPADAGAVVTFTPYAFDVVPPEQTTSGLPQCIIEIDNVSRDIQAQIDAALAAGDRITLIYRAFLEDTALDGPETDPPLTMTLLTVSATPLRIRATAGFPDLLNRLFPALAYDITRYPGLVP